MMKVPKAPESTTSKSKIWMESLGRFENRYKKLGIKIAK